MNIHEVIPQFPHCDARVLHEPGQCQYCDHHPDWQALRIVWGIKFTGKDSRIGNGDTMLPCPAEVARGDKCQAWGGNKPQPAHTICEVRLPFMAGGTIACGRPMPCSYHPGTSSPVIADTGSTQSVIPAIAPAIGQRDQTSLWTICPRSKCNGRTPWTREGDLLSSPTNCAICGWEFPVYVAHTTDPLPPAGRS